MQAGKPRKKINNYIVHYEHPLGDGSYGKVFICHQEPSQTQYAIKIIEKSQFDNNPYMAEAARQELAIHFSLKHKNIVQVIQIIQTTNNYYIVMEFCNGGSLRKLMTMHPIMSELDALHCIRCICRGFQPMLEKGIIHRDLKPQNIVIREEELKITDFGFAKALTSSRQMTSTFIGTPYYMSPQILAKQSYSSKCDIWSIGIIFYQLLMGKRPWEAPNLKRLYDKMIENPIPQFPAQMEISENTKSFILQCLQIKERQRLSWLEVYEHELLGNQFNQIAKKMRNNHITAALQLDWIKQNTQVQKIVGVFLRKNVSALNLPQFSSIIMALVPNTDKILLGPMYELFDKDANGVIDFDEFVGGLSNCPKQVLLLLNKLIMKGYFYDVLRDEQTFFKLCSQIDATQQASTNAFILINNIQMGQ